LKGDVIFSEPLSESGITGTRLLQKFGAYSCFSAGIFILRFCSEAKVA